MDNNEIQLVGAPCGQHGPYTFYKAFKYTKNGVKKIITLSEFFFVKLWSDSDLVCIGELQLLWVDKNSEQVLSSLRLYFLPENTPEGRMDHGEDEVLAISEKVVLRVEDLITWITVDAEWTWGRLAKCEADIKVPKDPESDQTPTTFHEGWLDFIDVNKERKLLDEKCNKTGPTVIILSYPRYCRYRAMMKRLEGVEDEYLKHTIVSALGGFASITRNTRILFCRDTFDYPDLEGHELLCNHLAPKLKGRPRGKRKKRSLSPGSESNESESSICNVFNTTKIKITSEGSPNGFRTDGNSPRRSTRSTGNNEQKEFLKKLNAFMKSNHTPIGRIPSLGYKELDLFGLYTKVQKLGGYSDVSTNRLWKNIFDDLSGNHSSTSAATVIRKHYERLLLPYERHMKGEEHKPLVDKRKLKRKTSSCSDAETSEGTSHSGNSTPVPQQTVTPTTPPTPSTPTEIKEFTISEKSKSEGKTSSLRSIRVKPERLRENMSKEKVTLITDKPLVAETSSKITFEPVEDSKVDVKLTVNVSTTISSYCNNALVETIKNEVIKNETIKSDVKSELIKLESVKDEPLTPVKIEISSHIIKSEIVKEEMKSETSPESDEKFKSVEEEKCDENDETPAKTPEIKTNKTDSDNDLIEVPYKPKTPEIIDLESEAYNSPTMLHSVKKRKLDILKEGGLEVTPVKPVVSFPQIKENRPSVIQQPHQMGSQVSVTYSSDKLLVAPSPISSYPTKRPAPPPINNAKPAKKIVTTPTNNSFLYINGHSPPKVMQSKSIYSYSEKTVYGNPKDYFMPAMAPPPAPKFAGSPPKGTDILDLTLRSPQKPMVEIMRVPNAPVASRLSAKEPSMKSPHAKSGQLPLLDGRVGSNLEITLVNPNNSSNPNKPAHHPPTNRHYTTHYNNKVSQKRTENYPTNKMVRMEENGKLSHSMPPPHLPYTRETKNHMDYNIPNPYMNRNYVPKNELTHHKPPLSQTPSPSSVPYPSSASSLYPGYFSPHFPAPNKSVPSYFPPVLDPFYYSALQSLYPHGNVGQVPPMFSAPTPEQLQFYTDLIHGARPRYPTYSYQGGNSSMTAGDNSGLKKQ